MSVNAIQGQFSQENRKRNTAIGAGVGAVAGAGIGYATKGIATVKEGKTELSKDVFNRAVGMIAADQKSNSDALKNIENLKTAADEAKNELGKLAEPAEDAAEEVKNAFKAAKEKAETAADKLKSAQENFLKSNDYTLKENESLEAAVDAVKSKQTFDLTGIKLAQSKVGTTLKEATKDNKAATLDDMKNVIKAYTEAAGKNADLAIDGLKVADITEETLKDEGNVKKYFGQIQEAVKKGEENEGSLKTTLNGVFENGKKKFKEIAENTEQKAKDTLNYVKKAAKSVKMKQAAIVGAAAAVVAGAVAFIASKAPKATEQKEEK